VWNKLTLKMPFSTAHAVWYQPLSGSGIFNNSLKVELVQTLVQLETEYVRVRKSKFWVKIIMLSIKAPNF
jgi:hypothetical protein